MRTNKKDFQLQITSGDIPKDIGRGLTSISIFRSNIVLRFPVSNDSGSPDTIISKFNIESLDDTRKELEKKLGYAKIEPKPAQKLVTFIIEKILDKMEQSKSHHSQTTEGLDYDDGSTKDKTEYVYEYSKLDNKRKKKVLHEAVILTSANKDDIDEQSTIRQPAFLYYDKQQDKIKTAPYIRHAKTLTKP
jgi:hypothetical protein